jgi:hypothetical protein
MKNVVIISTSFIVFLFTCLTILTIVLWPKPEFVGCYLKKPDVFKEHFQSNICSKTKNKIKSFQNNIFWENKNTDSYTNESSNNELKELFQKYMVTPKLNINSLTINSEWKTSNSFSFHLKNMITNWLLQKTDLKGFKCILVIPKSVYQNVSREPNVNLSFEAETIIHRVSKNIGKHLIIKGEILQNELHINSVNIVGSIFNDNLYFNGFSSDLNSSHSPYLSVYDFYDF